MNPNDLSFDRLATLVALGKSGSISGAARRTGRPKSTVAGHLDQLEAKLQVRLVERSARSVRLTLEGEALAREAQYLLDRADELAAGVKGSFARIEGLITLSVPILLGQTLLPHMLARFMDDNDGIKLQVAVEDRLVDPVSDGVDVAIRLGSGGNPWLTRRKLGESVLVPVASPRLDGARDVTHPKQLADLPVIGFGLKGEVEKWQFTSGTDPLSVSLHPDLRMTSLPAILATLNHMSAIALLPEFIVRDAISEGRLLRLCPNWEGERHDICAVFPTRRLLPARVRALVEHLATSFEASTASRRPSVMQCTAQFPAASTIQKRGPVDQH